MSSSQADQNKGIFERKDILQKLEQETVPSHSAWRRSIDLESGFIVKGKDGTSACSGDSGGPFLCKM